MTSVPVSIGKATEVVGEAGGVFLVVTVLQPRDHRLDRDHRVVDQQAERDDQRAQRYSLKVDPEELHRHEHRGEDQRDRERHDGARAQAED